PSWYTNPVWIRTHGTRASLAWRILRPRVSTLTTCAQAGGVTKSGRPCQQVRPPTTGGLCPWHDPNATVSMSRLGGQAAARAKVVPERLDLSTPAKQARLLERAVAGLLTGRQNVKAAAAIVDAVRLAARIYELGVLEERIKRLEADR